MDERERRKWLMAMSEELAANLSKDDWYDRVRFLREKQGMDQLERYKANFNVPTPPLTGKKNSRANNNVVHIKRFWQD